eukprot:COSAG01_NODE_1066_length_11878_cov_244.494949_17_plen_60_part_00
MRPPHARTARWRRELHACLRSVLPPAAAARRRRPACGVQPRPRLGPRGPWIAGVHDGIR